MRVTMNPIMKHRIVRVSDWLRVSLLGGAIAAALMSTAFSHLLQAKDRTKDEKAAPVRLSVSDAPVGRDARAGTSFSPVVKKVSPSVVKVFTSTKPRPGSQRMSPQDEFLRRFFGFGDESEGDNGRGGRSFKPPSQHGLGSGVIVTKDGYVLTNNHVIENADDIRVALNDGRDFHANVVGRDPKTDIAVLKVEAENLPYVTLADSDKLEIGDVVLAIGNPFGIGQTVTMGIVSAKGRTLARGMVDRGTYEDFIQTDAAINPGNSGGALVDSDGRLVGINTAIMSGTGGNLGIGFAVPVNLARFVTEGITRDGRVVRGYMGAALQELDDALAREFKLKRNHGALVADVVPKSPAEKAGLMSGDVIAAINDKPVEDSRTLRLQVSQTAPGTKIVLKVIREGEPRDLEITLKEYPDDNVAGKSGRDDSAFDDLLDGVTVGDIDGGARGQLRLPGSVRGAVVVKIDPDSPSYEAGLREGDVIMEINRKPVRTADDAVRLSDNVRNDTALLKVWRDGGSRYVVVEQKK